MKYSELRKRLDKAASLDYNDPEHPFPDGWPDDKSYEQIRDEIEENEAFDYD